MQELERLILATLVMDETQRYQVYSIDKELFEDKLSRYIFDELMDNIKMEPLALFFQLHEKYGVDTGFMDEALSETRFKTAVWKLNDGYKKRMFLKRTAALLEDQQKYYDPEIIGNELVDILNLVENDSRGEYESIAQAGEKLKANLKDIWEKKVESVQLPFLERLCTDLYGGELITIAGRPSMGKTATMLNMARLLALRNIPTAYISLEMNTDPLILRLVQKDWEKSIKYSLKYFNSQEKQRLLEDIDKAGELSLFLNDKASSKLGKIIASVTKMAKTEGCKVIFIDYLQLLPTSKRDSRNNEVAELSRRLKLLALDLNIVIVAGSQLSRGVEHRDNKRPTLADLRDSGAIEQDCDMVIFCFREGYYNRNIEPSKLELIVAKQRDGVLGTEVLHYNLERQLITNERA